MPKNRGGAPPPPKEPPAQKYRREQGQHHAKLQRTEAKAVVTKAVARKQPFPIKQLLLGLTAFAAFSVLLYFYLASITAEDEDEVEV